MLKKVALISLCVAGLLGCQSTNGPYYDREVIANLPDSYFDSKTFDLLTRQEASEWLKRQSAKRRESDRKAMCIFGTNPVLDRKALKCENVKGSPEYKALHEGD